MLSKKKQTCPICGRLLRTRCFVYNPLKDLKICNRCDKKIGHNKFYEPKVKGSRTKRRYTNLNIDWNERKIMVQQLVKKGLSFKEAVDRVNKDSNYVRKMLRNKRYKPKSDKDLMKNFLKGLDLK